jgi:hypothetical protein
MHNKKQSFKIAIVLAYMLILTGFFSKPVAAAPFEIEGVIKEIRTIQAKEPYAFNNKPIVSIYIVGHRFGKDFDYQYMIIKDSTQLEGVSFSDLKIGMYVRVKGRAEPAGMVGKPIQEIRASRYGCCNYALRVDTVSTPRNIIGYVAQVDSLSATDIVVTVRDNKAGAKDCKYLVVYGKTSIQNGSFSDIKVSAKIEISKASINVPVEPGKDHGKLYGSDLYAPVVTINKSIVN